MNNIKDGWRTTEFWTQGLGSIFLGWLAAYLAVSADDLAKVVTAIITAVVGIVGLVITYNAGRVKVKTSSGGQ